LWERYFRRLVGLARPRLDNTARRAADEQDVALSALASVFRGVEEGRFPQLGDRDDLWRLLVTVTVRKAAWQPRCLCNVSIKRSRSDRSGLRRPRPNPFQTSFFRGHDLRERGPRQLFSIFLWTAAIPHCIIMGMIIKMVNNCLCCSACL
jgi:hypothetical protein